MPVFECTTLLLDSYTYLFGVIIVFCHSNLFHHFFVKMSQIFAIRVETLVPTGPSGTHAAIETSTVAVTLLPALSAVSASLSPNFFSLHLLSKAPYLWEEEELPPPDGLQAWIAFRIAIMSSLERLFTASS